MKIAVPGLLILVGLVGLITMGILQGAIPEVGVEALRAESELHGTTVRLQGVIHEIQSDVRPMRFTIRDMQDPTQMVVAEVDDHRPDLFKVDTDVAVVGVYDKDQQVFAGTKIYTKCPSKYEESGAMSSVDAYGKPETSEPSIDPSVDPGPE